VIGLDKWYGGEREGSLMGGWVRWMLWFYGMGKKVLGRMGYNWGGKIVKRDL
jgi:hypothetical protein